MTRAIRCQSLSSAAPYCVRSRAQLQSRCYALYRINRPLSPQKRNDQVIAGRFIEGGTWQAPNPSKVQPVDVLAQLKRLGRFSGLSLHTAVVLATPSFTHWLDGDNDFLARLVQQLSLGYGTGLLDGPRVTIRTRSAIVDRLPSDTNLTKRSARSDRGNEGFSILLLGRALSSLASDPMVSGASPRNAHIRFVSQISETERQIIGLPVANTMFRNGRDSTMFEDDWTSGPELKKGTFFQRTSRVPLKSFDIAITPPSGSPFIGMPMSPLTCPSEVVSSIGNVIRQVKRGGSEEVVPASTDLEEAVPRFLQSPQLTEAERKSFSVFALITLKDFYASASDAVRVGVYTPSRRFLLPCLLQGRARLHRVTGGGGGWGHKKGLLSLEPGTDIFADRSDQLPALPAEGEDYSFESASALASPGEFVQFFATSSGQLSTYKNADQETFLKKEAATVKRWRSDSRRTLPRFVIGTNPPDEQYSATIPTAPTSADGLVFLPKYFGMLSEGGACLGCTNDSPSPIHVSFTSRLDIPFTTLLAEATLKYGPSGKAVRHVAMQPDEK